MRLGNACGNRTYTDFRHQLHADPRSWIGVLQVIDQLRQIFDRINVVMRRRRNQADAGRRVANARNDFIDFVAGELPAFTGFCTCAILICSSLALTRYWLVTPKRAEATCLIALDRESPFGSGIYGPDLLRLLPYCCGRRCDSSRSRGFRALPC